MCPVRFDRRRRWKRIARAATDAAGRSNRAGIGVRASTHTSPTQTRPIGDMPPGYAYVLSRTAVPHP